jgi:Ni/Co efflux regulator RcnB
MLNITSQINRVFPLMVAVMFFASITVLIDKPAWAGNEGKDKKPEKQDRDQSYDDRNDHHSDQHQGKDGKTKAYFNDRHRNAIQEYYSERYRSGKCPPGLAKKNNGCKPPGQAKKWQVGKPLPRDVVFHNLPESVLLQIGQPPSRQRFVRVASDILLIAAENGMVLDAMQNFGDY